MIATLYVACMNLLSQVPERPEPQVLYNGDSPLVHSIVGILQFSDIHLPLSLPTPQSSDLHPLHAMIHYHSYGSTRKKWGIIWESFPNA